MQWQAVGCVVQMDSLEAEGGQGVAIGGRRGGLHVGGHWGEVCCECWGVADLKLGELVGRII